MIPWTHTETFPDPDSGDPLPKSFVFEIGKSYLQFSAHDATICKILPDSFWKPVFAYPTKTVRIDTVDDHAVYLIGYGPDSTSSGRLSMIRLRFDRALFAKGDPATIEHLKKSMAFIQFNLAPHKFDEGDSVYDAIPKN
jgi:hypothetical protein